MFARLPMVWPLVSAVRARLPATPASLIVTITPPTAARPTCTPMPTTAVCAAMPALLVPPAPTRHVTAAEAAEAVVPATAAALRVNSAALVSVNRQIRPVARQALSSAARSQAG